MAATTNQKSRSLTDIKQSAIIFVPYDPSGGSDADCAALGGTAARGIYLDVSGKVTLTDLDGNDVEFNNMVAGAAHALAFTAIKQAPATATGLGIKILF